MAGIKKKVDVHCYRPFKLGITRFAGFCNNIILDADAIGICLENKAMVKEVLKNGKRVSLDFTNYNKKNPMGYDVDVEKNEFEGANAYSVNSFNAETKQTKVENVIPTNGPLAVQMGHTAPANTTRMTNTKDNLKIDKLPVKDAFKAMAPVTKVTDDTSTVSITETKVVEPIQNAPAELTATVNVVAEEKKEEEVKTEEKSQEDNKNNYNNYNNNKKKHK